MRWENLEIGADEAQRLPGYVDGAVVRRFDAPEAMDIRFYEVRAKSALNRVPKASQVPFPWTINPYRGCTHACTYCTEGATPILLADGRHKPMAELRVGDRIIGTRPVGRYRRYTETTVLDHWMSRKPAYRVTLEDGTEVVTSGDHRLLTERGWKHVTGALGGPGKRAHLTTGNALMGVGRFTGAPAHDEDYRRGYVCGMVRGDGTIGSYSYGRPARGLSVQHSFRLALADLDALRRCKHFLAAAAVVTDEFAFSVANDRRRAVRAIRTQARTKVDAVRELIAWPAAPSHAWRKGFLAGIFDAEGSCGHEALRISNTNAEILRWTTACLISFGFAVVAEPPSGAAVATSLRLRGGLREQLRFFHLTDPAIRRKLWLDGRAVKGDAKLGVEAVERLGLELPLYDITTSTGDYVSNGVVSHNCFARPTHRYLDLDAGRDFEREIVVKVNVPEVLRVELARPSWKGEHVALGTNTDPYQWVEGRYRLMPGIWEALRDAANPCSVLTKSPLVLRDIGLLRQIAERAPVSANLSVPTLDEKAWRATEPHTPHPKARLEAVGELNRAGIPCGVLVAPLMPGINDDPRQVQRILELASEAGATGVSGIALHLRGEVRDVFMDWLRSARPDLVARYEELYAGGAYAPKAERARLATLLRGGPVPTRPSFHDDHRGVRRPGGRGDRRERAAPAPVATSRQEALF